MHSPVTWTIAGGRVLGPAPFFVVGIVNCTPDSFYDGGRFFDAEQAVGHALDLMDQGADIVDIGGESTRPFSQRIGADHEKNRILPVMQSVFEHRPKAVLSVDTYRSEVAAAALDAGALIINDVSACTFDPELLSVLVEYKPGYVLMHSQGRPEDMQKDPTYSDVVAEIYTFFETTMNQLVRAGLPEDRVVLDPGIGFGKTMEHNLQLLANMDAFYSLGRPVYLGLSNKSTWGKLLDLGTDQRQMATQVATALMAAKGVPIHRVHEVAYTIHTLRIVQEVCKREEDRHG
jgi:dihydropteroate synthase